MLVKKYHVKNRSVIQKWVNQYEQYGVDGLRSKTNKRKYSFKFKLDALKFKQDTGASYKETANIFGISEPSVIANWKQKYISEGAAGLNRSIRRPLKIAKPNDKKETKKRENDKESINPSEK